MDPSSNIARAATDHIACVALQAPHYLGYVGLVVALISFFMVAVEHYLEMRRDKQKAVVARRKLLWRLIIGVACLSAIVLFFAFFPTSAEISGSRQTSVDTIQFALFVFVVLLFQFILLLRPILSIKTWVSQHAVTDNNDYFRKLLKSTIHRRDDFHILVSEQSCQTPGSSPPPRPRVQVDIDEVHCLAVLFNGLVGSHIVAPDKIKIAQSGQGSEALPARTTPSSYALIGSPVNNPKTKWLCEQLSKANLFVDRGLDYLMDTMEVPDPNDPKKPGVKTAYLRHRDKEEPDASRFVSFHLIPRRYGQGEESKTKGTQPEKREQWIDYAFVAKVPWVSESKPDYQHSILLLAGCKAGATYDIKRILSDLSGTQARDSLLPPRAQLPEDNAPQTNAVDQARESARYKAGNHDGMYKDCDSPAEKEQIDIGGFFYCIYEVKYTEVRPGVPEIDDFRFLCGRNLRVAGGH